MHNEQHLTAEKNENAQFGFWIYLMTDLLMFAVLFATYLVLRNNVYDGPAGFQIFNMNYVLVETIILLVSSFTCGMAVLSMNAGRVREVFVWFGITFLLGASFLAMELNEFSHLAAEGNSWTRSAFLSSYFTLVGTHGLHIAVGLLWMLISLGFVYFRGMSAEDKSKLMRLAIFWHFLDLVWIFIFTLVYLMGAAKL